MKVNEVELFCTLEEGLPVHLTPPHALPAYVDPTTQLGAFQHGQMLTWRDILVVTGLTGFRPHWTLLPLRGGRVVLVVRDTLPAQLCRVAEAWEAMALPVIAILDAGRQDAGIA